jgi:hypothetical protein
MSANRTYQRLRRDPIRGLGALIIGDVRSGAAAFPPIYTEPVAAQCVRTVGGEEWVWQLRQ